MHELPFDAARFDELLLFNVLTSAARPEHATSEAHRVLRPGGTLAIVTLNEHPHESVTAGYNHLQSGFSPERLRKVLRAAALEVAFCDVTSRGRKKPYFEVVTAFADKGPGPTE